MHPLKQKKILLFKNQFIGVFKTMPLSLILISALMYCGLHQLNVLLFSSLSLNPHISLIYLPAFIRLLNVLVLGPVNGTLATMFGGVLLLPFQEEVNLTEIANIACSGFGPLLASYLFKLTFNKDVALSNTKDLILLGLIYSFSNALVHHSLWLLLEPKALIWNLQFFEMMIGDITGTLLGTVALKAIVRLPLVQKKIDQIDKPK